MFSIYHNPRCSKSRQALSLLEEKGISPEIILYLEQTPSKDELKEILQKLGISADQLLRKNEADYKAHIKGVTDEDELIELMLAYPKVIERPIIIKGDRAVIGRPPEALLDLL